MTFIAPSRKITPYSHGLPPELIREVSAMYSCLGLTGPARLHTAC